MGPPAYVWSVVDQNIIVQCMIEYCSYINAIYLLLHTVQYVRYNANY